MNVSALFFTAILLAADDDPMEQDLCHCITPGITPAAGSDYGSVSPQVVISLDPMSSPRVWNPTGWDGWDARTESASVSTMGGTGAKATCSVSVTCFDNVPLGTDALRGSATSEVTCIREWQWEGLPDACPGAMIVGAYSGAGRISGSASVIGNLGAAAAMSSLSGSAGSPCLASTDVELSRLARATWGGAANLNIGYTGPSDKAGRGVTLGGNKSWDPDAGVYSRSYTLALGVNGRIETARVIMPIGAAATAIVDTTADGSWAGSCTASGTAESRAWVKFTGTVTRCPDQGGSSQDPEPDPSFSP